MKVTCEYCDYALHSFIRHIGNKLYFQCPKCKHTTIIDFPTNKIIMAFAYDKDGDTLYANNFTDGLSAYNIFKSFYVFNTPNEFMMAWKEMVAHPDGMWYWVMDDDFIITSGACDPEDEEMFIDYFSIMKLTPKYKKNLTSDIKYICELTTDLDILAGLQLNKIRKHYLYVNQLVKDYKILSIRVPGGTVGTVYLSDDDIIEKIVLDTRYTVKTYPEDIEELMNGKYVGVKIVKKEK